MSLYISVCAVTADLSATFREHQLLLNSFVPSGYVRSNLSLILIM
jgi:hypothetical protein